jgi:hypothetical protein
VGKRGKDNFYNRKRIVGINPFVFEPDDVLKELFRMNGKLKGSLSQKGTVNGLDYQQTLVKMKGEWRLYK